MASKTDWVAITERLEHRSRGYCERCGKQRGGHGVGQRHHRRLRSQGGRHTLDNLVLLCAACHSEVHLYPQTAVADGWIVPSWSQPGGVPVYHMPTMRLQILRLDGGLEQP